MIKPNIKQKHILLTVGILVVVGLLLVSIASYEQHQKRQQAEALQVKQAQAVAQKANSDKLATLQTQVTTLQTKNKIACDYLTALSTAKATKGLTTVPVTACQ